MPALKGTLLIRGEERREQVSPSLLLLLIGTSHHVATVWLQSSTAAAEFSFPRFSSVFGAITD